MAWIAIHDEILGSKLRGLKKDLDISDSEAVGILVCFWLWCRNNIDRAGMLPNTDRRDIERALSPYLGDNVTPGSVVESLIQNFWIDIEDDCLFVHDWTEWQRYWYSYLDRKEKDSARKRAQRAVKKTEASSKTVKKKPKPDAPKKVKYAEKVSMTEKQYSKLIDEYGKEATDKIVEKLDLYKRSSGKSYKDDYAAIKNWVVDECKKQYPSLFKAKNVSQASTTDNPFELF